MHYRYYVEGECERKIINNFKTVDGGLKFISGKVYVFNVLCELFNDNQLRDITNDTTFIFVYDTDDIDINKLEILKKNITLLTNKRKIKKIIHVQSIKNFEDEIMFSSCIKNIDDVFKTKGKSSFKRAFINCDNLTSKFKTIKFNFSKIWSRESIDIRLKDYKSEGSKIKTGK